MAIRTFTKDFLVKELELPYNAIEDKVVDNSRWSISHVIVFEYEGKFYRTSYSVGATEYQDERPWQYDKEVKCIEVVKIPVTVEQWVDVDRADNTAITIPLKEFLQLKKDSDKFYALEAAGVDNWTGYSEAMQILEEWESD